MRILIADDHELIRRGVRSVLQKRKDFVVCGEATDGQDAVQQAQLLHPDLVVMDITMPRLNGLEATREIRRSMPGVDVLVLSQHDSPEMMRQALNAGARGYVVKSAISTNLIQGIEKVGRGELFFDPAASGAHTETAVPEVSQRSPVFERKLQDGDQLANLLAAIVDSSDDAIISKGLDSIITSWNRGAERLFGYTAEETIGKPITIIIPPDRRNEEADIITRIKRGERMDHFETVRRRKDGTLVDVSVTISPVKDGSGRVIGASKVARDISERKRHEERLLALSERLDAEVRARTKELEQRNADVLRQSEQLRQLSWRLWRTEDEERRHVARELHDSAGQTLAVLAMTLSSITEMVRREAPQIVGPAERADELVAQLTREIRTTSYLLHPPLIDETGLPAALSWYVRGLAERSGLEIALDIQEGFVRLSQDLELAIFRLVQESLTNVHRHSGSRRASIRIAREAGRVTLEIRDEGKGISPERLAEIQSGGSGVGIRGMRERLRQFHGELAIESSGCGTTVLVTIPVAESAAQVALGSV